MNDLVDKLRILRKKHGYKQDFVGKHLGISQTGYSKIEAFPSYLSGIDERKPRTLVNPLKN